MMDLIIRRERLEEQRAVEELTREAFWNLYAPGGDEHLLVHTLRDHSDFLPELNFVAELDGRVVGNIMGSKSRVVDEEGHSWDTVTFGPLSVLPEYQGGGVGGALMRYGLEAAKSQGHRAVIIYGFPGYYKRFGFEHAKNYGVSSPEGKYPIAHLVFPLYEGALDGVSGKAYESPVFEMDPAEVEAFDANFPPKDKEIQASQQDFLKTASTYLD